MSIPKYFKYIRKYPDATWPGRCYPKEAFMKPPLKFTYTNQLEESSEYTVTTPDFKTIYQTDIELVQKLIDESSDPDFLEAALEILDSLQHFNDVLNNTDLSIIEEAPTVLFLVLDKKILTPGKQPPIRNKKPKTIIKDSIREQLQSSKIRMFSKQELGRNSFDLGLLGKTLY